MEFCSDNTAVVEVLRVRYIKRFEHSFAFTARHVAGSSNVVADALSQFNFQRFRQLVPQASPTAILVPPSLLAQLPLIMVFLILGYIAFNSSVSSLVF